MRTKQQQQILTEADSRKVAESLQCDLKRDFPRAIAAYRLWYIILLYHRALHTAVQKKKKKKKAINMTILIPQPHSVN